MGARATFDHLGRAGGDLLEYSYGGHQYGSANNKDASHTNLVA